MKRTKSNSASSPGSRSLAFSFVGRFTRPFAVRACVRAGAWKEVVAWYAGSGSLHDDDDDDDDDAR